MHHEREFEEAVKLAAESSGPCRISAVEIRSGNTRLGRLVSMPQTKRFLFHGLFQKPCKPLKRPMAPLGVFAALCAVHSAGRRRRRCRGDLHSRRCAILESNLEPTRGRETGIRSLPNRPRCVGFGMASLSCPLFQFPTVYRKGKPARPPESDIVDFLDLVASNEKAMGLKKKRKTTGTSATIPTGR